MSLVVRFVSSFTRKHPISRGMLTYAVLWPTSNITQQLLIQRREVIDWKESMRYSFFGACYVAPTLYGWIRLIGILVPGNSFRIVLTKTVIDQMIYSPFAITSFYVGMGLLEGRKFEHSVQELKEKFLPTYKAGACVWPVAQMFNFAFVKERNRIMVIGIVSFFWTVWMSYMKQLQINSLTKSTPADRTILSPIPEGNMLSTTINCQP